MYNIVNWMKNTVGLSTIYLVMQHFLVKLVDDLKVYKMLR